MWLNIIRMIHRANSGSFSEIIFDFFLSRCLFLLCFVSRTPTAHITLAGCGELCSWRVSLALRGFWISVNLHVSLSDVSPTSLLLQLFCRFSSILYSFTSLFLSAFSFALSNDGLWLSVGSVTVTLWSGLERQRCGWAWYSRNRLKKHSANQTWETWFRGTSVFGFGTEVQECLAL